MLYSRSVEEKAVIVKQKVRKSLKTPDETVTVNFVPQQSNVKSSFPVTHVQLLKDDDLSSPGEREGGREEGEMGEREGGREGGRRDGREREREREGRERERGRGEGGREGGREEIEE